MTTLSGYTVGITADRRSDEQIRLLEGRGAQCIHGPMLETQSLLPEAEIALATEQLINNPPDITILSTGIGVRGWFSSADATLAGNGLRTAIEASHIYTRGPKAQGAAMTAGLDLHDSSTALSLNDILDDIAARGVAGKRIAIQLDGDPDAEAVRRLKTLSADVITVPVYQWTLPTDQTAAEGLVQAVASRCVDALTFTARPAAQNFVEIAREMDLLSEVCDATRSTTFVFCVGEQTASAVSNHGLGRALFPDRPRLGAMVMMLTKHLAQRSNEFELSGHRVVLRGRELQVSSQEPQLLNARERQVFEVLLSRPGTVFSKGNLLDWVWRGAAQDEHTVEVAIARLRKRLGEAGTGIETVRRRGYRVAAS